MKYADTEMILAGFVIFIQPLIRTCLISEWSNENILRF